MPKRSNTSHHRRSRRIMRWQDRTLLALSAILVVLFIIRTETAIADEQAWGLQLKSDSGVYTELAIDTNIQLDITGLAEIPQLMRQVVFITDGAVGNETELLQMVAQALGSSRMFTVAIGHAPNSWFMRKAAEIGRGSYVHIGKSEEVEAQMSALWGRIQLPALTDICVEWGEAAESYPEIIPDLYAGEPLWVLTRLRSEPTIIGLCGSLNGLDKTPRRNGGEAMASSDVPGLLPAGSTTQLAGFPSTATGWVSQLLLSLLVLLLATSMLVFSGSRLPMLKPPELS